MKNLIITAFLLVSTYLSAATCTVCTAGGNYSVTTTWTGSLVPTSADAVVFTAGSGQLTVASGCACASIDFTNYTNTVTWNNTLTVSGNVTFVAAMTITTSAGTPLLISSPTASNFTLT